MKRREILQRRKYAAVPKRILARRDLTPSDKVIYTTLIGQLFSDEADTVELSTADLAAKAGLSQRTVRGALRDLEATGLIASHHAPGVASVYMFPTTDTDAQPRQNLPTPPAKSAGVPRCQPRQNLPTPPAKSAGPPAKSAYPYKEVNVFERFLNSPLPPNGEKNDSPPPPTKATAINALAAAYLEATGRTLPDAWSRDAGREYDTGDRAILNEIDAATIRRGMAFAERRNIAFAFRTLVLAIHQKPRPDVAAAQAKADQAASAAGDVARRIEAEHNGRLQDTRHAALAYFRNELDEPARQRWRDTVASLPAVDHCGPDGIEILAAVKAYNDRPRDEDKRRATG